MRGFPPGTRYTPVPDPLLGTLLEQIDDAAELKCTLRMLWVLHQKGGQLRFVAESELLSDGVLNRGLAPSDDPQAAIRRGLLRAVERGTVLVLEVEAEAEGGPLKLYFLNDVEGQRAIDEIREGGVLPEGLVVAEGEPPRRERSNIFTLYEDNIGLITPVQAERLKEAEKRYPWSWVREAFEEAVVRNKRSWRYIESILERWATEGRGEHGEPGRHPEAVDPKEYGRSYGRYVRE